MAEAIIFSSIIGAGVSKDNIRDQCEDFGAAKIHDQVYTCKKQGDDKDE